MLGDGAVGASLYCAVVIVSNLGLQAGRQQREHTWQSTSPEHHLESMASRSLRIQAALLVVGCYWAGANAG